MGSSTSSDVVKFAARYVWEGDMCHLAPAHIRMICGEDREEIEEEGGKLAMFDSKGWEISTESEQIGKHGDLYAQAILKKGEHTVYTINESPYAAVGEMHLTLVANVRTSLALFMVDFGLNGKIEENESVHQTS